jgi:excisionase family DNA binding protein
MNQPLLLRMNEAARLCAVSKAKLYKMVHEGSIPAVKFGKSLRIPYESLKSAIEQNTCSAPEHPDKRPMEPRDTRQAARK